MISLVDFYKNYLLIKDKNDNLIKPNPNQFQIDFLNNVEAGKIPNLAYGRNGKCVVIWN